MHVNAPKDTANVTSRDSDISAPFRGQAAPPFLTLGTAKLLMLPAGSYLFVICRFHPKAQSTLQSKALAYSSNRSMDRYPHILAGL